MSEHGGGESSGGGEGGVIANLLAKIGFKVDTQGLEHFNHRLEKIHEAIRVIAGIEIVHAIAELGERFSGIGSSLEAASVQTGLATDSIQKLQYAGAAAAISSEDLTMGIVRLSRQMFQAQKGGKAALDVFSRVGISKEQLDSFTDTKQAFLAVADGVNHLGTQQEKLGVIMQLFGRGGAKYLKLLRQGSAGIEEAGEQAVRVGAIISHKSIENLEHFEQAATSTRLVMRAFLANVAGAFIPAITRGLRALEEAWGHNRKVIVDTLSALGDTFGLFGYAAMLTLQNLSEFVHRIIYGGKGIGGSLHGLLEIVEKTLGSIGAAVSKSIGELVSNGSFSVFVDALKNLFLAAKTTGTDVVDLFAQLAHGLGALGGVDTSGIDKTTVSLTALLAILTGIVQMAGMALTGIGDIVSGRFFSSVKDASNAYLESKKYDPNSLLGSMVRHNGTFASGMAATGALATSGPASMPASEFVGPPAPSAAGPVQMSSTINVTAAPGMSTEQLAKQIADKNAANLSQMFRESRRDTASPLIY